jgi:integral membrane protein
MFRPGLVFSAAPCLRVSPALDSAHSTKASGSARDGGMRWYESPIGRLRVIGFWEGISFLVLLGVAMPLKYFAGWPLAVRVVGMAHGVLFMLYILAVIQAAIEYDWPWRRTALVLAAGFLPGGPFIIDARVLRKQDAKPD